MFSRYSSVSDGKCDMTGEIDKMRVFKMSSNCRLLALPRASSPCATSLEIHNCLRAARARRDGWVDSRPLSLSLASVTSSGKETENDSRTPPSRIMLTPRRLQYVL